VALAGYYLAPVLGGEAAARLVICCGTSISAACAVFAGLRRFRPAARNAWLLISVAQLIYACGDVIFFTSHYLLHTASAPAASEALYLAHYPVLVAGLLTIARRRAPAGDLPALLDGLLVATAATTVSYVHVIEPRLGEHLPLPATAASVGLPLADIAMLAIGVRLLFGTGFRPPAFVLLTASLLAMLIADTGYALRLLGTGLTAAGPLDGVWLVAELALGAVALHPTMAQVARPVPPAATDLGRGRLLALYLVGIAAPLTLAVGAGRTSRMTELATAVAMAISTALIMVRMRYTERLQRLLANTDVLTGLYTRRYLDLQLALAVTRPANPGPAPDRRSPGRLPARRSRGGRPAAATVALFLVDVDHFKAINDCYGHPAGDRALAEIARRLRAAARSGGVVARYGGEEFALLVARAQPDELGAVGERLRASVAARPVQVADGVELPVTVSIGAALTTTPASPAELIGRADRALYAAKSAGRDRVVLAEAAEPGDPGALAALTTGRGWWPPAA
jgi:diguanylate cyclase (GGDEF)-like protein